MFPQNARSDFVPADLEIHGYSSSKPKRVLLCSHPDHTLPVDCRREDLDGQLNGIAHHDIQRSRETWYALISDSFENGAIICRDITPGHES
jgi:hypothetical protein